MKEPCPLEDGHDTSNFDCGVEALDIYLQRYARQTQKREGARTYVVLAGNRVVAYYTIVFGGIDWNDAPEHVRKGLGKYSIPIMMLGRLAVDKAWAGKGLGNSLLLDALQRALAASEIAGLRAVVVDAKDDAAKRFYEKRGFRSWPVGSNRLFVTIPELKREAQSGFRQ
ncbi:MAG: GNAT family N-acetyltransferase [Candidatus Obscuribacterales bacterium]|nr:GNAT family N-acetyltransferase [Candidatus Obscuribacterales bacterium]